MHHIHLKVLSEYNLSDTFNDVKTWYDGYNFKNLTIYNPWSILNYLSNEDHELKPYWVNTGGTGLLKKLIFKSNNIDLLDDYKQLLDTGYIEHIDVDLYMDLKRLKSNLNTIWTLFMLSGYLTPEYNSYGEKDLTLKIPNKEIEDNLKNICIDWFNEVVAETNIVRCLYEGDVERFSSAFKNLAERQLSYYDIAYNYEESVYHAFSMGLLYGATNLYNIKSNRESGLGRFDLVLIPKSMDRDLYIIEFKKVKERENFEDIIEAGFKQIEDKKYDMEFMNDYNVKKVVIAFRRKDCQVEIR